MPFVQWCLIKACGRIWAQLQAGSGLWEAGSACGSGTALSFLLKADMRCMCIVELSASPLEAHPERLLALHDRLTAEPGLAVPLRMDVTLQLSILSFEYENLDSPTWVL